MTTLTHLQSLFQRQVLDGDPSFADVVALPPTGSVAQRISIYTDAYRIRLREALASNYPHLRSLLGEPAFTEIADAYIEAQPSKFRSIRWFGDALPAHLRNALKSQPWVAELAEWEWALAGAFDAADATPITVTALSNVPVEEWPSLRFALHPSVHCLRLRTNAAHLFKALAHEAEIPSPCVTPESFWLISRFDLATRYRSMAVSEWRALCTLLEGGTFEAMCSTLVASHDPHETALHAAQLLRTWIDEALVCNVIRAAERTAR